MEGSSSADLSAPLQSNLDWREIKTSVDGAQETLETGKVFPPVSSASFHLRASRQAIGGHHPLAVRIA